MALSKKVFLASSVYRAFIDRAHPKHDQASAYLRYFAEEEYYLFTDPSSLLDAYRQIYADVSPSLAKDFMRTMYLSTVNILYSEERDYKAALKTIVNYKSTDLTFEKALMAVLCARRDITQICTFDYLHPLFGQSVFYLPI